MWYICCVVYSICTALLYSLCCRLYETNMTNITTWGLFVFFLFFFPDILITDCINLIKGVANHISRAKVIFSHSVSHWVIGVISLHNCPKTNLSLIDDHWHIDHTTRFADNQHIRRPSEGQITQPHGKHYPWIAAHDMQQNHNGFFF